MFTLLSALFALLLRKDEFCVVILGLDNAGKTTLLERIKSVYSDRVMPGPERISPTVGCNVGKLTVGSVKLLFWDLGGQQGLHSIWKDYYVEAHAVIYVVDSTDIDRLDVSRDALEAALGNEGLKSVPLLVLFNKQDVDGAASLEELSNAFKKANDEEMWGARAAKVSAISAIDGDGVQDGVQWLVSKVSENRSLRPPKSN